MLERSKRIGVAKKRPTDSLLGKHSYPRGRARIAPGHTIAVHTSPNDPEAMGGQQGGHEHDEEYPVHQDI